MRLARFIRRRSSMNVGRQARFVALLAALAVCGLAGLFVGSAAFGRSRDSGEACDQVFCAQWGINGFASRLWIKNVGSANITTEAFSDAIGTVFTGVAGTTACQATQTQTVTCDAVIAPGGTFFGDLLAQGGNPPVGASGTVTANNDRQGVFLQDTSITGTGPSPPPPPPPSCRARLHVDKTLSSYESGGQLILYGESLRHLSGPRGGTYETYVFPPVKTRHLFYYIKVTNTSECEAKAVAVEDTITAFGCAELFTQPPSGPSHSSQCAGLRHVHTRLGNLAPGKTARFLIEGAFIKEGEFTNTARAIATNATAEKSVPITTKVVSEAEFKKRP